MSNRPPSTLPPSRWSDRPPLSERPPSAWEESFVTASDGTKLYVRRRRWSGEGKAPFTAVLCDGIACDGFIWRYLVDDLRPHADVLHWNYRGHGRSGAPVDERRVDIGAFVDDLERVREAQLAGPLVLFGHSMGCQLVLEAYRRRAADIDAMVLICGTSGRLTHTFKHGDGLARALPRLIERVERRPRLARALWSNVPPEVSMRVALATGEVDASAIHPEDLLRYSEHVAGLDLLMFLRMLHAVGEQTADDMLGEIAVPTLILAGENDTFTPPYLAEKMAASIAGSELTIYPGATHVVPVERREEVRQRLEAFFATRLELGHAPDR
ncbi:MAG: alpha/beta hydrolase [Myxococcales bacterium]|nr:alpha/beta hydrolase [Myxococcales bacterium]